MRRILPRHPDAAVQLHALLGGVHRNVAAVSLRDGRGDARVFVAARLGKARLIDNWPV